MAEWVFLCLVKTGVADLNSNLQGDSQMLLKPLAAPPPQSAASLGKSGITEVNSKVDYHADSTDEQH